MGINVLQLTDIHLFADITQQLKGINTEESLLHVLARITREERKPDIVLLTGDLAERGEAAAYQRLLQYAQRFPCPVYAIPDNHDDLVVQEQTFVGSNISLQKSFIQGGWHFILLNSVIPQHAEGKLSQSELNFLQSALLRHAELPTLIAVHHHVQPVHGSMDAIMLRNADAFLEVIAAFANVRIVLCGHAHQVFDQTFSQVRYLTAPSTCYQIKVGDAEFIADDKLAPGYRWLVLDDDGTIETEVVRVDLLTNSSIQ